MEIYIGNIPKGTRPTELKKLLKESVKASVFTRMYEQAVALGRFDNDIEINIIKRKRLKSMAIIAMGTSSLIQTGLLLSHSKQCRTVKSEAPGWKFESL